MNLVVDIFISDRNSRYPVWRRRRVYTYRSPCLSHVAICFAMGRTPGSFCFGCHSIHLNISRECTVYNVVYSNLYSKDFMVLQKWEVLNVEDQHDIPQSWISFSYKCFLTKDIDSIIDCNTRVTMHSLWELCCQGPPARFIKHLGGVQIGVRIVPASTDN